MRVRAKKIFLIGFVASGLVWCYMLWWVVVGIGMRSVSDASLYYECKWNWISFQIYFLCSKKWHFNLCLISFHSILILTDITYAFDAHLRGPSFVMEPPPKLEFSNSSGGWLDCSASGSPQPTIDWLSVDGTSIGDVGGIRRVLRNGTLVLLPFPPSSYRQDIHNTVYRCVASNSVGRVISRDVQIRAGELL